jgi:subtilisin
MSYVPEDVMKQKRQFSTRFFAVASLFIVILIVSSLFTFPLEGNAYETESHRESEDGVSLWPASETSLFDASTINVHSKNESAVADENPDIDALLLKSRDQGAVRVLVQLAVPLQPDGHLTQEESERQQQAIRQAQDTLLAGVVEHEGVTLIRRYSYVPLLALELDEPALLAASRLPIVRSIQEDIPVSPGLYESTPLIKANQAWTSGYTGSGWTIAILDTGVDKTHPFLAGKIVSEACYSSNIASHHATTVCPNGQTSQIGNGAGVNCPTNIAGCAHGTHVAGIAAGSNATFSGVAREATIIAIQVFSRIDHAGSCHPRPSPCVKTYSSDWMAGLERVYTLRNNYNIASANMSLGGGKYTSYCDGLPGKGTIDNLSSAGIATIIASGNDGHTDGIGYPACISTAISVGNTTKVDTVYSESNSASFLHLLAPGTQIYSSVPGGNYASFNGTSMAAPHVAGAWAILKQNSPGASVTQILNTLVNTGVPVTDARNGIVKRRIQFDIAPIPTPTPSPTPGSGACNNIIKDGSFEISPTLDWYATGSAYHYSSAAHSGNYSILLGHYVNEESVLWQNHAIPANLTSASVSFWYYLATHESGSTPYDHLVVSIRNVSGSVIWATIAQLNNTHATSGWTQSHYNLTASQLASIAGQSGRIEFRLTNDYSLVTQVLIDDVVWNLCSGSGGTATPPPTAIATVPPSTTPAYTPVPGGLPNRLFLPAITK